MIYIDVSDSCRSPMNTGIQRVVRGLFRALRDADQLVTPMLWEQALESYCALSQRERFFLKQPFGGTHRGKALAQPSRTANPIPVWSKFLRQMVHRRNRMDLGAVLKSSDLLLVPQVFRDNRGACATALGSRSGMRCIGFFHDAIPWRRPDVTPAINVAGVVEYMMGLADFDVIIAASQEAADDLRACWQKHHARKTPPVHVLGWPVDESFGAASRISASAIARPKILCVGTLEARKNHSTLLAAAEMVWREHGLKFELELIGRTTRECGPRVLAEVQRLSDTGWPVAWRRHVDNETLLTAYDECAFTVFPSLVEGFGLPIMESLRRGKPCICGANGALGELATGGGCVTVDQTDAKEIAEAMHRLLTDGSLFRRLSEEARTRQFENWPGYVAKLLPLIQPANGTQPIA